jgi:hypothetical protein
VSDERTQDLVETLQDPFPRPAGFSRLMILRSESGPSMAITTILLLLVAIVLFALRAALFTEEAQVPSVAVQAVSLSEGDREALDLEESTAETVVEEAEVDSQSEPAAPMPKMVAPSRRKPGSLAAPELPGAESPDTADAEKQLADALGKLRRRKQKKAADSQAKAARGKAKGGVPSGKELSERLASNGAGTGDVQVSMAWNNGNDIDVAVACPSGELIYFGHKRSACRGQLDIDRNAGGPTDLSPVENIFWATGDAPKGRFAVLVKHYANHGFPDPTGFIVRVSVDGQTREFRGMVTANQPPVTVHQFTRR